MTAVLVMGVSGSGKSTVGPILAARLGIGFVDGDGLHPSRNRAAMAAGLPLDDADRAPWLDRIAATFVQTGAAGGGCVVACSALRRRYRDRLRATVPALFCAHLDAGRALLASRLAARTHEYMPASLLGSQLAALEPLGPDEAGVRCAPGRAPQEIADEIVAALAGAAAVREG